MAEQSLTSTERVNPAALAVEDAARALSLLVDANGQRRDRRKDQQYLTWKSCAKKSGAWKAERQRVLHEANLARSQSHKDRPGAGAQERPSTDCGRSIRRRRSLGTNDGQSWFLGKIRRKGSVTCACTFCAGWHGHALLRDHVAMTGQPPFEALAAASHPPQAHVTDPLRHAVAWRVFSAVILRPRLRGRRISPFGRPRFFARFRSLRMTSPAWSRNSVTMPPS